MCVCMHSAWFIDVLTLYQQNIPIPTMDTGAEVAKRFYKELTDIQVSEDIGSAPEE